MALAARRKEQGHVSDRGSLDLGPQAFWGGKLDLPKGTELPIVVPSADGATAAISKNEFFAMNEKNAQGLSV